jgi:hypothetical protein
MLTVPQDVRRAWKAARPKKSGMRYEHAAAIVAEGIKRGTRRHRAVALGVAAQFELTMRQADVIGVWERIGRTEAVEPGAIVESGRIWRPGLRFEDLAAGQLDLETLKNAGRAVFDVAAYPLFQEALAAVPATERHGPLVTDENGRPVSRRYYWDLQRCGRCRRDPARSLEHARAPWRGDRGPRGWRCPAGHCRARAARRHQHDAQALHRALGRDVTPGGKAAGGASPSEGGQQVKPEFCTAAR